jgi:GNAT superfamily N-acetyltransferase
LITWFHQEFRLTHTIIRKEKPAHEDILAIAAPLQQFNLKAGPPIGHLLVTLQILDLEAKVVGGLFGQIAYDWLHIEYLIVPETLRHTGLGSTLMLQAEQIASERNCVGIYLDTLAFQALPFYEKLGYTLFGKLEDHPRGSTHYFLQKRLAPAPRRSVPAARRIAP